MARPRTARDLRPLSGDRAPVSEPRPDLRAVRRADRVLERRHRLAASAEHDRSDAAQLVFALRSRRRDPPVGRPPRLSRSGWAPRRSVRPDRMGRSRSCVPDPRGGLESCGLRLRARLRVQASRQHDVHEIRAQSRARPEQRAVVLRPLEQGDQERECACARELEAADDRRLVHAHAPHDWQLRRSQPTWRDSQRRVVRAAAGDRLIAEGADRYRRPGLVERLGMRLSKLAWSPAVRRPLKRLYVHALMLQTRGRGLAASLPGGESVRVLPEHGFISWNPDEYRAFRDAVRPGMNALDVGANVGAYSLLLGQWVGSSGAVFAFEPAPEAYDGLRRHIGLNNLAPIVTPVRAAVGAASSTARFVVEPTAGESRLATAGDGGARTVEVPVTTIDDFCARNRLTPDFIKIDVEGAELDVLRGARETIQRTRGRLALFVEMHPSLWPRLGTSLNEVTAELEAQKLDAVPLTPTASPWAIEGVCLRLVPRS